MDEKTCPHCKSEKTLFIVDWAAKSLDPTDSDNSCEIEEYQCRDCFKSFWI